MSYQTSTARYLEAEVLSRPTEWLVPLLYEHLLAGLHRADVQIEQRDFAGKAASLDKVSAIVMELAASLDHEQGGELARNLSSLYAFFASEILSIGRSLDRARLGRLIAMAKELHEAWTEAAEAVAPRSRPALALA